MSLSTVYADGGFLDAKWDVLRRHRVSEQSFEDWLIALLAAHMGLPVEDGPEPVRFFLENGGDLLGQVFDQVRLDRYDGGFTAPSADPVFAYYAATELYRAPMRDASLPLEARLRLAPTFVHLAQREIDAHGPLHVDKETGAFLAYT